MTSSNPSHHRNRRMAREPQLPPNEAPSVAAGVRAFPASPSRLDQLVALLVREQGTTIAEMMEATGWQQHSVRGAMAGALKKRGLVITSQKIDGARRYHATRPA